MRRLGGGSQAAEDIRSGRHLRVPTRRGRGGRGRHASGRVDRAAAEAGQRFEAGLADAQYLVLSEGGTTKMYDLVHEVAAVVWVAEARRSTLIIRRERREGRVDLSRVAHGRRSRHGRGHPHQRSDGDNETEA